MNYEIVDLILPEGYDKEKAKKELNKKYTKLFMDDEVLILLGDWLENNASKYLKELKEIENSQPKYDREFWEQLKELNKDNFRKMQTSLIVYNKFLYFEDYTVGRESLNFEMHELDLINKQYRLMQEIAYSRLEEK
jgi:hypothetical protein